MEDTYDVFISYSRKDTDIANQICNAFDKHGITYFIDRQGIGGGQEFPKILANAICNSKLFLYLASKNSYESKFTTSEITFAFNEKSHNYILPYIIDGSDMPIDIRFTFSAINWRNIKAHPIETTLVQDICKMLGKSFTVTVDNSNSAVNIEKKNSQELFSLGYKCDKEKNYTEAVKYYREAAELGNAAAQNNLGNCYYGGYGVTKKDYAEAVKWYLKSAEQGNAVAQYNLGNCYENGDGVTRNYAETVKWYLKAAEQGYVKAQIELGDYYENGYGVNRNFIEAIKWYRKAVEQGNVDAMLRLGYLYCKSHYMFNDHGIIEQNIDYSEAVKWYRKAAEQGNKYGQYHLGDFYYNGKGVTKDYPEAVKWYRKSAEQGDHDAKDFLQKYGFSIPDGDIVDSDKFEPNDLYRIGRLYEEDEEFNDYTEAAKWYNKAIEQGHVEAYVRYYCVFPYVDADNDADATPPQYLQETYKPTEVIAQLEKEKGPEAFKWFRKAADLGDVNAQLRLGDQCVAHDWVKESLKWYRKAAELGNAYAQCRLGEAYFVGQVVTKNYTEAIKWYRMAADRGNAEALYSIGQCYHDLKNRHEAIKWYRKAAELNHSEAQRMLKKLDGNWFKRLFS
jgi:hypothetical protein